MIRLRIDVGHPGSDKETGAEPFKQPQRDYRKRSGGIIKKDTTYDGQHKTGADDRCPAIPVGKESSRERRDKRAQKICGIDGTLPCGPGGKCRQDRDNRI